MVHASVAGKLQVKILERVDFFAACRRMRRACTRIAQRARRVLQRLKSMFASARMTYVCVKSRPRNARAPPLQNFLRTDRDSVNADDPTRMHEASPSMRG